MLSLVEIAIINIFSSSGNLTENAIHIMVVLPRTKIVLYIFIVVLYVFKLYILMTNNPGIPSFLITIVTQYGNVARAVIT